MLHGLGIGGSSCRRARPTPAVAPDAGRLPPSGLHVHWYRRLGDDPVSGASLYGCRGGGVRAAR